MPLCWPGSGWSASQLKKRWNTYLYWGSIHPAWEFKWSTMLALGGGLGGRICNELRHWFDPFWASHLFFSVTTYLWIFSQSQRAFFNIRGSNATQTFSLNLGDFINVRHRFAHKVRTLWHFNQSQLIIRMSRGWWNS